jgi:hypothetical protein
MDGEAGVGGLVPSTDSAMEAVEGFNISKKPIEL